MRLPLSYPLFMMNAAEIGLSQELARRLVRQSWRALTYRLGEAGVTAERIAAHTTLPLEFVRDTCELAGYPLATQPAGVAA